MLRKSSQVREVHSLAQIAPPAPAPAARCHTGLSCGLGCSSCLRGSSCLGWHRARLALRLDSRRHGRRPVGRPVGARQLLAKELGVQSQGRLVQLGRPRQGVVVDDGVVARPKRSISRGAQNVRMPRCAHRIRNIRKRMYSRSSGAAVAGVSGASLVASRDLLSARSSCCSSCGNIDGTGALFEGAAAFAAAAIGAATAATRAAADGVSRDPAAARPTRSASFSASRANHALIRSRSAIESARRAPVGYREAIQRDEGMDGKRWEGGSGG